MRQLIKQVLAIVLLAVPVPASAQDLNFDMWHTLACLDEAVGADQQRACVGASAGACMEATPSGSSTVGMGACLDYEYGYWDDRLNASYQALRAREKASDAEWSGHVKKADALRDMQRAWIGFRDATCDYERAQWGGGTGGGPATAACLLRMTGEQTLYLEQMMVEY